jgi:aryl-alcohol dehydrogenase-like predicted oxidoreductase
MDNAKHLLRHAVDLGINQLDTADAYRFEDPLCTVQGFSGTPGLMSP